MNWFCEYTANDEGTMIELDGNTLTLHKAAQVVFAGEPVVLKEATRKQVERSHKVVTQIVLSGKPVYGINTGIGRLSNESISSEHLHQLQRNVVLSHAVGIGAPLPEVIVRAILLFRINSLLKGYSGIRMEVIDYLIEFLNRKIHPIIPSLGSVGASGDLVPLAHLALVLLGEGEAFYDGRRIDANQVLSLIGRPPVVLSPKEGLALLNGTQYMSGLGFLACVRADNLLTNAIAAAALSLEALRAFSAPFEERLHQTRPHPGQVEVASRLRRLLDGSKLLDNAGEDVQDAYSLRCVPQVLGAAWEALAFLKEKLEIEVNAATDNPLVFPNGTVISGGNFHGQILGLALEMLTTAMAGTGNIAERRIDRLLTSPGRGLPLFLAKEGGLNSGLMLAQYTAAALASENKIFCHPAFVDSIPTSGGKEDHNSMASVSARKAIALLDNLERIIAVEYLCAAQALDFQSPNRLAQATRVVYERVRDLVPHVDRDRPLAPDIARLAAAVASEALVRDVL